MPVDISALWNFGDPALSEECFRTALTDASDNDKAILLTQIARTYGLRRDFEKAREILATVNAQFPEAKVRKLLELGRTYASMTHKPDEMDAEQARTAYLEAFDIAKDHGLDGLAVDALHMMTVVDPAPEKQIEWNEKAIEFMEASSDLAAKKWAGSLYNNLGYALHLAGRYDEALAKFELSLKERESAGNAGGARVAKWMIAWTHRAKGDITKALQLQLALEHECEQAGEPDPYVFEELEKLYDEIGDSAKAAEYHAKRA